MTRETSQLGRTNSPERQRAAGECLGPPGDHAGDTNTKAGGWKMLHCGDQASHLRALTARHGVQPGPFGGQQFVVEDGVRMPTVYFADRQLVGAGKCGAGVTLSCSTT